MSAVDELGGMLDGLFKKILERVSADFVVDPAPPEDSGARAVTLSEQIEAAKAASAYYIAKTKVKSKLPREADEETPNFGNFKRKLQAVEGGKE